MNVLYCDRHRAMGIQVEIEPGKHSKGSEELIGARFDKMEWDLCEACDVELRRFMGGAKLVEA